MGGAAHTLLADGTDRTALTARERLSDSVPVAIRRHAARVASRTLVLLAGDLIALVAVRTLLLFVAAHVPLSRLAGADVTRLGPLASPGRPGSTVFWLSLVIALGVTGSYSRHRGLSTAVRLAVAVMIAAAIGSMPLAALLGVPAALERYGAVALATWLALLGTRSLSELFLQHVWPRQRGAAAAILVGPPGIERSPVARAIAAPGGDYRISASLEIPSGSQPAPETVQRIAAATETTRASALLLSDELARDVISGAVAFALAHGVQVLIPARALRLEGAQPRLAWHHDQPFLEIGAAVLKPTAVIVKRVADVVGAALLLLIAAPIMAVIAAWVKIDSPGPVLFAQDRAGLGGRRFRMLKFRTMHIGADDTKSQLAHLNHSGDIRLFKIPSDPRVTTVGRVLRRWSLDELPQLWNVLVGEMSLVGPRPFFRADFAAYEDHHFHRLDAKPGITGLWQVSGRSEILDFDDVVFLDRQYIENWSIWLDISILFRTIPAVFRRTGAY